MDITRYKSREIIELINTGKISCVELMKAYIARIKKYDPVIEAFISLHEEDKLIKSAEESDRRRLNNKSLGKLDGIPIALKDNMHATGLATTCASRILENYDPPYDSTVAALIKKAGGIIIGKTNMDEFAMGTTCENSAICHTRNPWDIHRVPGGSSGGSAAAVSAGMVPFALGSDTGGSVRAPASFCGVTGTKPTYGLVSRYGLIAFASSLDQIGPISMDVYGNALLLNLISGHDVNDSTSLETLKTDYTELIGKDIKGVRIAVFKDLLKEGISNEVADAFENTLKTLKNTGAVIEEVDFKAMEYVIAAYYFIACAEASSNLSRYDGVKYGFRSGKQSDYQEMLFTTRSYGFGREVKKRILLGNFVLSSGYYDEYYRKAQKVRALIREKLKNILRSFDAIAMPTTPDIAFKHGEGADDPMKIYLSDITTVIPNLTGVPAVSVPCGKVNNMPVGLQLIGSPLDEKKLFQVASAYERNRKEDFFPDLDHLLDIKIDARPGMKKNEIREKSKTTVYTLDDIKKISDTYNRPGKSDDNRRFCADLEKQVGKYVILKGWIHRKRDLGGIEFFELRDRTGLTQLVLEGEKPVEKLTLESVVEVSGKAAKEERSPYNNIEIKVEKLTVLSHVDDNLPININVNPDNLNLPTILDNRPLSLRNPEILSVFKVQSEIVRLFGEYLRKQNFTEIKTSKISSSGTEGGTNIFEVKYFDRSAYLAQSPQFYKQFMVGSGLERVFEVGPVFRAEHHDTIRHINEYTSMDFEMGFIADELDVINMQEGLIQFMFDELNGKFGDNILKNRILAAPGNIPRIHFLEAMEILKSLGVRDMEEGDITPAGEKALCDYFEREMKTSFVYVIGYPVKKRPMYTMPDERLPGYTRSFDLLFKGIEITTGGQRIHNYHQLRDNIVESGFNPGDFRDYLSVFKYGMPPHGGLGMGLERLTMKVMNLKNIREATLFPRDINRITP